MFEEIHEPTQEQRAIDDRIASGKGSIAIQALAGGGKTSTLLHALPRIPQQSILMAAFNRPIAETLQARLPKMPRGHVVHVKTFHALGWAILRNSYPHLEVSKDATEELVTKVCAGRSVGFQARRWICRLVKLLKDTTIERVVEPEEVIELGNLHGIFGYKASDSDIEIAVDRTLAAYDASLDLTDVQKVDFCDQPWLPVMLNLRPMSRYQAIFVDELQDISRPQLALLQHVALPTTRMIAVGDPRQAIYGWRGGMGDEAFAIMHDRYSAETMWLTTSFRCAKEIVRSANAVLTLRGDMNDHAMQALPDANDGAVSEIALADLPNMIVGGPSDVVHTFVLSRTNDMLLKCALFMHRQRVKFQLIGGRDLLAPLFELLDHKLDMSTMPKFLASLAKWKKERLAKAEALGSPSMADRITEQSSMLGHAAEACERPTQIKGLLAAILTDNQTGVHLMTVHKAKGLEAQRVFLLKQSFMIEAMRAAGLNVHANGQANGHLEEINIEYVAITRAKEHLIWVDMEPGSHKVKPAVDLDKALALIDGDEVEFRKIPTETIEEMFAQAEREAQRCDGIDLEASKKWTTIAGKFLAELQRRSRTKKV